MVPVKFPVICFRKLSAFGSSPMADPQGPRLATCAAVGTLELAVLLSARGSHEDRCTRAAQVASLGSGCPGGTTTREFDVGAAVGASVGADARDSVGVPTAVDELVAVPAAPVLPVPEPVPVGEVELPARSGMVVHAVRSTSNAPKEHWRTVSRLECLVNVEPPWR